MRYETFLVEQRKKTQSEEAKQKRKRQEDELDMLIEKRDQYEVDLHALQKKSSDMLLNAGSSVSRSVADMKAIINTVNDLNKAAERKKALMKKLDTQILDHKKMMQW